MTEDQIKEAAQAIVAMRLRTRPKQGQGREVWKRQMEARRLIEGKTYSADPIEDLNFTLNTSNMVVNNEQFDPTHVQRNHRTDQPALLCRHGR